ncbi:lytic transglycosylase domain-containing protein [Rhodoferax aquaticus]|uniref:Lytic transglycosylase domain-containing protein n=1 Tax=Rhodoferax aquaticus TaxID=2527691 RepID=A0A515EML8_9BURK|nr:lytic transglycosylase domain-containing protein [Rhodoferax aquaticus]QDL53917.1 lytic transglycosylase domain-containing protein [Rhodoferax aquaticus]
MDQRKAWRVATKWLAACAVLTGVTVSLNAFADVWSYVDARGVVHFASSQLDAKYELFFKGKSKFDATEPDDSGTAASSNPLFDLPEISSSTAKRIAYLEFAPGAQVARPHMRAAAQAMQVDYALLQAVIATESGFDRNAVSPKGAVGLMQIMPATAERYGVREDKLGTIEQKLTDPRTNVFAGTRYLRDLIQMFPGQLDLAIASYNAGEGAVQKAGNKVPNYKETQNYVKTVMELYAGLNPQALRTAAGGPAQAGNGVALASGVNAPSPSRVRAEFHGPHTASLLGPQGGATGRGNMLPSLGAPALQSVAMASD